MAVSTLALGEQNAGPVYLDTHASIDARAADLVSRMTLEEKAIALNHAGPDLERFLLPSDKWNQCLNGVQWNQVTTLFPTCIAMSATWDTPLIREVAGALADEARAIYNGWHQDPHFKGTRKGLIYRAPVINIGRNPYWGRNHEAYGEDPFLTGRMAVAYVQGLQGNDSRYLKTASTLKHFAVNNVEVDRLKLNAIVPERWLREYWLPHFRDAVVEGKAQSLMASYNAINGTPNNINHWLLTDLLKSEWKHEGFVVSDLGGVQTMVDGHAAKEMAYVDAVAKSVMAGCDFSDKEYQQYIPEAVRQGKLSEARLNDAVTRVMKVRMRLGEFDPHEMNPYSRIPVSEIHSPEHRDLSLKVAQESIVLLQNKGDFLPLDRTKLKRIAVIGPVADCILTNYYSGLVIEDAVTPVQGIRNRVIPGTLVKYTPGAAHGGRPPGKKPVVPLDVASELETALDIARTADVVVLCIGTSKGVEQEDLDRTSLGLSGNQQQLVEAVMAVNPKTVVVLMSAGPLTTPWIKENVPALLQAWWPGEQGGNAIADVLFGNVNPAGRLPHTVYASDAQVPPLSEYDVSKGFTYMYLKGDPLYAFGHGLTYTRFAYSNLDLLPRQIDVSGLVTVSVDVKNVGDRDGDEVVQLYVHAAQSNVVRAAKELRGFSRSSLKAGESRRVRFQLPAERMAYWDENTHQFVVEPGAYDILVGSSSQDIREMDVLNVIPEADHC